MDVEDLQDGAPGDEGVDEAVLHFDETEAELAEVGEGGASATQAGRVRELPEADVEAADAGDAKEHGPEGHVERPRAVDEGELLDALGGQELEPARELGLVGALVAAGETGVGDGSRVRFEDGGDGGDDGRRVGGVGEKLTPWGGGGRRSR